jgi:hypothetical protein
VFHHWRYFLRAPLKFIDFVVVRPIITKINPLTNESGKAYPAPCPLQRSRARAVFLLELFFAPKKNTYKKNKRSKFQNEKEPTDYRLK